MKQFYDHGVLKAPQFAVGDWLYLEREKHSKRQPVAKLAPKCDEPYEVLEKIGELSYRLKLTVRDQRHSVFHVDHLRAAKPAHIVPNREFPEPSLVVIDKEEEYEVEEVLDLQRYRWWKKLQYLVHWKGWGPEHNSWEDVADLGMHHKSCKSFILLTLRPLALSTRRLSLEGMTLRRGVLS